MLSKPNISSLHITIGATPTMSGAAILENDIYLLKAALLYADEVELCSLAAHLMMLSLQAGKLSQIQQLSFMENFMALTPEYKNDGGKMRETLAQVRRFLNKPKLSKEELFAKAHLQGMLAVNWSQMKEIIIKQAVEAGAEGLISAVKTGLVKVHPFKFTEDINDIVMQYFRRIQKAASDGTTYPLFDDQTGDLFRASIDAGITEVSDVAIARSKHIGLAADMLQRLPLFDAATIDQIVDVRKELSVPLIRFRAAVIKFSEAIKTAAWDVNFAMEAENVLKKEVEPAVLEIEEAISRNHYLRELVRKVIEKPGDAVTKSVIGIGMSQFAHLPATLATAIGVGVGGAGIVFDTYKEWYSKRELAEKNQLFFYYRAGALLPKHVNR